MAAERPRVTVVTNGNAFSNLALGRLFRETAGRIDYQVIVTTGLRRSRGNRLAEAWSLFRRWGWRYAGYKVATYVVPLLRQTATGRSHFVARTCRELGIPVRTLRSVNTSASRKIIAQFGPDLLLSYSCPYRIYPKALALPRIGCLNVHSSLLPAYAGVCTYVHVLADGAPTTGVTVHEMVEEFDAGRIVAQSEVPVAPGVSVCRLFAAQSRRAGEMLGPAVEACLQHGEIRGAAQDAELRTYRGEPDSADIARLRRRGHTLMRVADVRCFSDPSC